ncbi:MAG TPA: ATP-binding protein [Anaerolineales bacterium]|nr:ATP-binding protein [Anaerolineales bacterium]
MNNKAGHTGSLRPNELEAVYAISRAVAETLDFDTALADIVRLARPVFIFDNAVLYLVSQQGVLEPAFARAIGRGRSSEDDSAWGELAANGAFANGRNFLYQPELNPEMDRLQLRFYLGLPLLLGGKNIGALVFIRFGGPVFTDEQIHLAEFIAAHVTQVLEHKRLVDRVANLEAERRLARLQSEFIAMVSHELKTPLGFIKGYSTTLLREDTRWDEAAQREFLTIIDEETDRLTELVENLLDSSRLQSGTLDIELRTLDLASLVEENIGRLLIRYPKLVINWKAYSPDSLVGGDPKRLSQVIDNLIGNAAKYAPNSPLQISLEASARQVRLSVRDSGPGIPAEDLEHVFKRFYRSTATKDKVRGSGLGLYICEQIIKAHHGEIHVKSTKGLGTEFLITLPRQTIPQPAWSGV